MAIRNRNRRFIGITAAAVGALGLAALAVPLTPAKAQLYFGVGPGGFDVGVAPPAPYYYSPYYSPYYYPPYPYRYHRW